MEFEIGTSFARFTIATAHAELMMPKLLKELAKSAARMLADHWDKLPLAAKLFRKDPPFEVFVLAGINITDRTEDLNRIDNLASKQCPANLHVLCTRIRKSIRENQ